MKVNYWYTLSGTINLSKEEIEKIKNDYNGDVKDYLLANYNLYEEANGGLMGDLECI